MPESRYNIAPNKFVHWDHESFGLREAVDKILAEKGEIDESNNKLENMKEERIL